MNNNQLCTSIKRKDQYSEAIFFSENRFLYEYIRFSLSNKNQKYFLEKKNETITKTTLRWDNRLTLNGKYCWESDIFVWWWPVTKAKQNESTMRIVKTLNCRKWRDIWPYTRYHSQFPKLNFNNVVLFRNKNTFRENSGFAVKYSWIWLEFFLYGIFYQIRKSNKVNLQFIIFTKYTIHFQYRFFIDGSAKSP